MVFQLINPTISQTIMQLLSKIDRNKFKINVKSSARIKIKGYMYFPTEL